MAARTTLRVLLIVGVWLLAGGANAATYYVRTSGNDGSSGLSPGTAWRTIEHAGDTMVAGDIAYIGGGTYPDGVDVQNSGTAANPIRFIADTAGTFTGDAGTVTIADGGDIIKIDNEDHIHVFGVGTQGGNKGYKIKDAVGIRIEDCTVDSSKTGIEVDDSAAVIVGCDLLDNDDEGIEVKKDSDVDAEDLVILRSGKEGIKVDDDDAVVTVNRCEVSSGSREGIFVKKGTATIVNCVVAGNAREGVLTDDDDAVLTVWHSTIVANTNSGVWIKKGTATVRDSILASNQDNGFENDDTLTHSFNLVWGNSGGNYSGTAAGTGEISVNPVFVGGGDYHLQVTSPAIDVGLDSSAITSEDRDARARPEGWGWDLGAYERPPPDHFAVSHDGTAEVCVEELVTITRHLSSHATGIGYTGTITLATSSNHGDWSLVSGSGTLVNAGGGSATYTYAAADAGQVVLGFVNDYGEAVSIDVSDGTTSEVITEDPALVVTGGISDTYRDDFGAVSWGSQNGTLPWSTNWLEVDGNGIGPGIGNAWISGGELVLDDFTNTNLDSGVERQADLSAHSSATFQFDFRTTSGVDPNDAVFVDVSSNGGATWTVLERITGIAGAVSGSRSYDISTFISTNTRVRFRVDGLNGTGGTSCCYGAANEEFRVQFAEILVPAQMSCGPDHYAISHDGTGITCQAENITITSHDALDGVLTDWTGTITLGTSTVHGDWSIVTGAGMLVNSGGGLANYTFDATDLGVVVLALRNTFAETLSVNVSDGDAMESPAEDPGLTFETAGFSFLANGVASTIGTQIGAKPSNVAPGAQTLELEAIRTSDSSGTCEAALQGNNDIELAFTCEDPSTCAGAQVTVNGSAIAANPAGTPAAWTPVSLDFGTDTDTTAPILLVYPDVGRIQVHARFVLTPSSESLNGASNPFVVRPFAFDVTVPGNPGATGPTGPLFAVAGADFTAALRAVLWQAADDTNADGVADGHGDVDPTNNTDLSGNATAVSYGREVSVEAAELSASLVLPSAGTDPGLGGTTTIGSFTAGSGSSTAVFFDEVGVAELSGGVADGDYLGIGPAETARIAGHTGHVGRFRPQRFDVSVDTAPVLASGCTSGSGFTYVGERFGYATAPVARVTARSAQGTQTRNYTGTWWKITNTSLANRTYSADPGHPVGLDVATVPPAGGDPTILQLGNGVGTLTFGLGSPPAAGLRFARGGPVAPFDAEIALSIDVLDTDGVTYASNPFAPPAFGAPSSGNGMAWSTSKQQRYGRLRLTNASGSELSALTVPLRAEYWTGAGFALNGDDGCTVVTAGNVPIVAANPPALAAATSPAVANAPLLSGDAGLSFSAPGAGNDGTVDIRVGLGGAGLGWLGWDWTGDGAGPTFSEDPAARLNFGIYPGDEPVIFRREVY